MHAELGVLSARGCSSGELYAIAAQGVHCDGDCREQCEAARASDGPR